MDELTAEAWRDAKNATDLGELTIRWLEKTLAFHPCDGDSPDEETNSVQKYLVSFNRNGLLTTFSQPAEKLDEEGFAQRAAVEGFAEEATAKKIAALGLETDLLIFVYPPDIHWGYRIPITLWGFRPYTWVGPGWGFDEFDCFAEYCSGEALQSLKLMWKVVIIDLQWGREEHLWHLVSPTLMGAAEKPFDITTSPEHGDIEEFVF